MRDFHFEPVRVKVFVVRMGWRRGSDRVVGGNRREAVGGFAGKANEV